MKKLDMPSYEDAFSYYNTPNHEPTMKPSKNTQQHNERSLTGAEKVITGVFILCYIAALVMWLRIL